MNIRDALERIKGIQEGLSVTLTDLNGVAKSPPLTIAVKRAYRFWPDSAVAIDPKDTPCWINNWNAPDTNFLSVMNKGTFTIQMGLLCYDEDSDSAADIASAFYPAVVQAFSENIKLGGAEGISVLKLRGAEPTLADFGQPSTGGANFIGLHLFLDIQMHKSQAMSP
jgi:hypothetical protein